MSAADKAVEVADKAVTGVGKAAEAIANVDYSPVMEKVGGFIGQMIDAATPVAKQAYEIGLMTLQVDAAATLIPAFICMVLICVLGYVVYRVVKWDMKFSKLGDKGFPSFIAIVVYGTAFLTLFIGKASNLFSVWIWVKLFKPELWLAHVAIEKILTGVTK